MLEITGQAKPINIQGQTPRTEGGPTPRAAAGTPATPATTPAGDQVELSAEAEGEIVLRDDVVARVRELIDSGKYLTPERIDGTVNRLLAALGSR
jgi:hypothetical protein